MRALLRQTARVDELAVVSDSASKRFDDLRFGRAACALADQPHERSAIRGRRSQTAVSPTALAPLWSPRGRTAAAIPASDARSPSPPRDATGPSPKPITGAPARRS